ncbi:MAG: methyltransferase domain-containing protein [Bacteroidota bacterium]
MKFIPEKELHNSPVVANCRMNRSRQLTGINSYDKEIGIDIGRYLKDKIDQNGGVSWLDICCGEGNALLDVQEKLSNVRGYSEINLTGIDLVGMFNAANEPSTVRLIESPIEVWEPQDRFDLITCIHGLHYIGDKLSLLTKIPNWLKNDGVFYGNLDLENIRDESNQSLGKSLKASWKKVRWAYQSRRRMLRIDGDLNWPTNWKYVGADDQAGPNYTGQEAVNSYYSIE